MTVAPRAALAASVALVAAAPALAAGGGGEGEGSAFFYSALNLAILLAVLVYFARKPIKVFFAERRNRIQQDLQSAADLHREAEERYAEWQRRLVDLDRELEGIRDTARQRAEAERDHILADARAAAERIERDAAAAIDQEVRRSQQLLREEAADLATELAAGLLRDQVSEDDRSRLLDEFIARIGHTPAGDAGAGR